MIIRGNDRSERIIGTNFDDLIYGYAGDDIIDGRDGDDEIWGGADDDDLIGGLGYNTLIGGSGRDWFISETRGAGFSHDVIADFEFGTDTIDVSAWGISDFSQIKRILTTDELGDATIETYFNGYANNLTVNDVRPSQLVSSDFKFDELGGKNAIGTRFDDMMFGSSADDILEGGKGNDHLDGGKGYDDLYGNGGQDKLFGGGGRDFLSGGRGADLLKGERGEDLLKGNAGADLMYGGRGNDELLGGNGADILRGNAGNDLMKGGRGFDQLFGGRGDDVLFGGRGPDELTGGRGDDTFVFTNLNQSEVGSGYRDLIRDFQTDRDKIDLLEIDARPDMRGDQAFDFIGQDDFSDAGQVRYYFDGGNTIVEVNTNRNYAPDMEIALSGRVSLIGDDFVL